MIGNKARTKVTQGGPAVTRAQQRAPHPAPRTIAGGSSEAVKGEQEFAVKEQEQLCQALEGRDCPETQKDMLQMSRGARAAGAGRGCPGEPRGAGLGSP